MTEFTEVLTSKLVIYTGWVFGGLGPAKLQNDVACKNTKCKFMWHFPNGVFHKLDEIGNNANIGIRFFTM